MVNDLLNFDIKTCSETELKLWLGQVIPLVSKFIEASTRCINAGGDDSKVIPCNNCFDKSSCNGEPCEVLNAFLPSIDQGKGCKEINIGISLDKFKYVNTQSIDPSQVSSISANQQKFKTKKTIRETDIYEEYKKCWHRLKVKQREVIEKFYKEGLTRKEISHNLKKSYTAVCDLLKRAEKEKEKYESELRAEKFNLLKNLDTE